MTSAEGRRLYLTRRSSIVEQLAEQLGKGNYSIQTRSHIMFDKEDWLNAMRAIARDDDRFHLKSPQFCVFGWCICAEHLRNFRSVVLRWANRETPPTRPDRSRGARDCPPNDQRKGWKYRVDLAPSGLASFVRELGRAEEEPRGKLIMSELKAFDVKLREIAGDAVRPFLCTGSPLECEVFLVGINPATDIPLWAYWSNETGCDKKGWLEAYVRKHGGFRPTRKRIESVLNGLSPVKPLETNILQHRSRREAELTSRAEGGHCRL